MSKEKNDPISSYSFDYWIFDLDNTLYDIKLGLFKKVSKILINNILNIVFIAFSMCERFRGGPSVHRIISWSRMEFPIEYALVPNNLLQYNDPVRIRLRPSEFCTSTHF